MLPEKFKERMRRILGDEAEKLFFEIESGSAVRSFRVNTIKIESGELDGGHIDGRRADFPPECFYTDEEKPGYLACHHAGMIYMQDPSAMATVHAARIEKGARVLDSCSAPGGKTTQLSALVGDGGMVLANEYDAKRCRILQGNIERLGCTNTVVTNLDTAVLAKTYPDFFDIVLCDAPCSGEGMFRKNELAISEWSEENVIMCAERQREILGNVAKCVAAGGYLIYSTCTFSLEENEYNVDWFLREHTDFELCAVEGDLERATADGISFEGAVADMRLCRRFYPHISRGEGQFIALLRRKGEKTLRQNDEKVGKAVERHNKSKDAQKTKIAREEADSIAAARAFICDNLSCDPTDAQGKRLVYLGGKVYISPDISLPEFSVFAAGACVGELERGRFTPHHQLFSAYGRAFKRKIDLPLDDTRLYEYLRGLEISAEGMTVECGASSSGYAAVLCDGASIGGGKVSGGVCKNHYPKGLRNQK